MYNLSGLIFHKVHTNSNWSCAVFLFSIIYRDTGRLH